MCDDDGESDSSGCQQAIMKCILPSNAKHNGITEELNSFAAVSSTLLAQFFFTVGHVALRQLVHA